MRAERCRLRSQGLQIEPIAHSETAETAESGFPATFPIGYACATADESDAVQPRSISEADIKRAIEAGAAIRRVVVVELSRTGDFVPYLRLSDRPGYVAVAMRRYEGAKRFSDFRTLRRWLARQAYAGICYVVPDGHPLLAQLHVSQPELQPPP